MTLTSLDGVTPIERLMATEEIKQLKARYFRFIDTNEWDNWKTVFAPDAVLDVRDVAEGQSPPGDGFLVKGPEAIVKFITDVGVANVETRTIHHGYMPEIEIISLTSARGIWAMEDRLYWPDGRVTHGYGHYHETYQKIDRRWLISSVRLPRLRVEEIAQFPPR
jgi:hypothetical protein